MPRFHLFIFALFNLAAFAGVPGAASAAESYDNCTGVIASIPTVITTPGVWCLKKDLSTAISSGKAIDIQVSNVVLDCNNFKLGGLAAGVGTATQGIYASGPTDITVRRCNIRGFYLGVFLGPLVTDNGSYLVEDNRLDSNTAVGIDIYGTGSIVRRNHVFYTGGSTAGTGNAYAILINYGGADIVDNTVSGVSATSGLNGNAIGILMNHNSGVSVRGNNVRGLVSDGTGTATALSFINSSDHATVRANNLIGTAIAGSIGVTCNATSERVRDNVVNGFVTGFSGCTDDGTNSVSP